jgi:hypothetical protein
MRQLKRFIDTGREVEAEQPSLDFEHVFRKVSFETCRAAIFQNPRYRTPATRKISYCLSLFVNRSIDTWRRQY